MAPRSPARPRQGGFTYLGLIILVTVIGLVGAATLKVGALLQRAAAEEELLDIGAAFSAALESYAAATPQGQPTQPPTLQELLKDPRTPGLRRHLRKIFVDPVSGSAEWGIVYLGERVGVVAVHSLSQLKPLKIGNFDPRFQGFERKEHLSDWKFTAGAMAPALSKPGAAPPMFPAPLEPGKAPLAAQPEPVEPFAAPVAQPSVSPEVMVSPPEPPSEPEEGAEDKPDDAGARKPAG
jgi:type II secretory pathway pseudopilin PulG